MVYNARRIDSLFLLQNKGVFSLSTTRKGNIKLIIRSFADVNKVIRKEIIVFKFGSVIVMLGCPLANAFRVVHTIPHEVMGK